MLHATTWGAEDTRSKECVFCGAVVGQQQFEGRSSNGTGCALPASLQLKQRPEGKQTVYRKMAGGSPRQKVMLHRTCFTRGASLPSPQPKSATTKFGGLAPKNFTACKQKAAAGLKET
eukprot:107369-Pelagomonas_calceolata.AAC.4